MRMTWKAKSLTCNASPTISATEAITARPTKEWKKEFTTAWRRSSDYGRQKSKSIKLTRLTHNCIRWPEISAGPPPHNPTEHVNKHRLREATTEFIGKYFE